MRRGDEGQVKGGISRREFLKGAASLGLSLVSLASIARISREVFGQQDVPPDLLEAVRKEGSKLNVYNWSFYIAEEEVPGLEQFTPTIEKFEEEFGVSVTYDLFESQEEMLAKVQAGASGYDVVVVTNYYVPNVVQLDLVQPLKKEWLPNLQNLMPRFLNPFYDPDNKYSVAYLWGTTGYGYNTKFTKEDPRTGSWGLLMEGKEYAGKITMMDSIHDVINAGLKYLGFSLNTDKKEELLAARDILLRQKPLLRAYISGPVRELLIAEEVWISHLWTGDVLYVQENNPAVEYALPTEGSDIWVDNMTVLKDAPHPAAAHLWINYILRPQVMAGIATYVKYPSPNQASLDFIPEADRTNPIIYPSDEDLAKFEFFVLPTGEALRLREEIWDELKGG